MTVYGDPEDAEDYPESGCYVHGLSFAGASWEPPSNSDVETVGISQCGGYIDDAVPKQQYYELPVMLVMAVRIDPRWTRTAIGYMREAQDVFECPVYSSCRREFESLVFTATLRTMDRPSKWIMSGAAILLQSPEDDSAESFDDDDFDE